ncbi:protein MpPEX11a [Marchantia polymorpha subsp. ruderalis]|uniref:Peroxisomal membrane protein 11A n=2 Tax=Marchantia polymorpha TaxID=3197 RepID=A0A176VDW9_MARPO|nr:hypothetical protein AXG93_4129s1050 [Marchantia polymorpha subsp. ruderalis]PTQ49517.1 hypothetical protein MARPO_0002s0024 [Marchantia polymorpha]BBN00366.1 hypothetical protein Mp_1g28560 [Marchantia polymorpha subsp. ruderalis]|eukprot:PTQ49517.1 hypothetical protein MARPO_0002s0024 [Marchantia polymorpha]
MAEKHRKRAFLEHLEAYLARRDGVDKALKILRYSSKLWLSSPLISYADPLVVKRVKDFESSVGTSRKAFRLGKFVQDVNALGKIPSYASRDGLLEFIACTGEGIYYFVEQFIWLVKAGAIDKRHSKELQKWSAWSEFIGYLGSVTLKFFQVWAMRSKEAALLKGLNALNKGEGLDEKVRISKELRMVRAKRSMKTLSLVQDLSDSLLALNDIKDNKGPLAKPFLLAFSGLLSALISTHKNWNSC